MRTASFSVAAFVAGAVLLGVEIAASRVLAPFFGSSLFVWGALIGVVLTGLSCGYWIGGALADRLPTPGLMLAVLCAGAASVLAIPLVDEPVLEWVVAWDPGPRADPLVAAVALFGLPSILLATVTPVAVRLVTISVATLGRSAGRLFAISTGGSIAGTFATAFWLVPELGTDQLLAAAAAALFGVAALFALTQRLFVPAAAVAAGSAAAAVAAISLAPETGGTLTNAQARNWSPIYRLEREGNGPTPQGADQGYRLVFRKESRYHRVAVVEDGTTRILRFDNSFQSAMYLGQPFRTRYSYTDFFHLALAYDPGARDVLFVGLGGGSAPKRLWRDVPEVQIDVAELDPVVADVARRYFALPRSPRLQVTVQDGRRFLDSHRRRWDAIAIDAFYSDSIPFHLTTREFLELARSRLKPGGVIVTNVIGAISGSDSKLFRSLYRTYATVFPTVLVHPVKEAGDLGDESVRNLIVVATDSPAPSRSFLAARWRTLRADNPRLPDLAAAIRDRHPGTVPTGDVPVLTDDYAPTDALLLVD